MSVEAGKIGLWIALTLLAAIASMRVAGRGDRRKWFAWTCVPMWVGQAAGVVALSPMLELIRTPVFIVLWLAPLLYAVIALVALLGSVYALVRRDAGLVGMFLCTVAMYVTSTWATDNAAGWA